ncbi:MAG: PLDc_N domain-containing protein [Candidatus Methanoperedens sp.]|nr:PLDc_N domain-containing protein [Candidatus Methanoperedens sp.]
MSGFGIIGVEVFLIIAAVMLFVFWVWMLIDCLKRPDNKFKIGGNNAKPIWILVIILTGFIGTMIYYFLIKKTDSHQDRIIGIVLIASVVMVIFFIAGQFVVTTRSTFSIEPYPPGKLPQSVEIPAISPTPITPVLPPVNQTLLSNATTFPAIMAIQPDAGTTGTKVVITGTGFTTRDNNVAFRLAPEDSPAASYQVGYINNIISSDGRTIEFVIPDMLGACAFPLPETTPVTVCPRLGLKFKPGTQTYPVFVVNQNGTSNSVDFTMSR